MHVFGRVASEKNQLLESFERLMWKNFLSMKRRRLGKKIMEVGFNGQNFDILTWIAKYIFREYAKRR